MGYGAFIGGLLTGSLLSDRGSDSGNWGKVEDAFNDLVQQLNQKLDVIDDNFELVFDRLEKIEDRLGSS